MSERILKALMQLFSIVSNPLETIDKSRHIVIAFLTQQLPQQLVNQYLALYDDFVDEKTKKSDGARIEKRTAVNSVKILLICTQINEELTQKQKIIVLIRLLEFIYANNNPTEQELEFVFIVSERFNIPEAEYQLCSDFIKNPINIKMDLPTVLIINNTLEIELKECKHIYAEGIKGEIRIIKIESVKLYFLRYFGETELYLNGFLINKNQSPLLNQGASIKNSRIQPIYYSDIIAKFNNTNEAEKVTLEATNISYKFQNNNVGIYSFSFTEESNRIVGIMGASGSGKSTLLNLLNGNYLPSSGSITINGIDIHKHPEKIEGLIGFISQDDLLIEELTVFQNLYYNTQLCFGNLSENQILKKVSDVLNSTDLIEVKDLKVGNPIDNIISGGQRKRLNIALEIIREPAVLFVDEPTSGLSSRDSEKIMDLLKLLTFKGKLVFVVIHQPSSDIFKMFDNLLILDKEGYLIYNGNPVDSIHYFKKIINHVNSSESECLSCGNVSSEQIFNIIEAQVIDEYGNTTRNRKITPKEWHANYLKAVESKNKLNTLKQTTNNLPKINFKIPNKYKQFKIYFIRDVLSKLTDRQYILVNLLEAPVIAFILAYLVRYYNTNIDTNLGYVFSENNNLPVYIFISIVAALFLGLTISAEEIIRDQKIRKREKFLNLSKSSYLLSKIAIMFVISSIQTLSFVLVGNSILAIEGMTLTYWFVLFSIACFANMMGLNISSSFNSPVTIYNLIPFLIIPQLLLSGVIVNYDKLNPVITHQSNVPLVGELMASRWAYEALLVHQFKNNAFEKQFYDLDRILNNASFKKNYWLSVLYNKLDIIKNNYNNENNKQTVTDALTLLNNEINNEIILNTRVNFLELDNLTSSKINKRSILALEKYLNKLNQYYLNLYKLASNKKDKFVSELNNDSIKKATFIEKKNRFTNEAISDIVKNNNEINRVIEIKGQLVQKINPIYLYPTTSRAHFFAPIKLFFRLKIQTYWYNVSVIWLMSLLLMILLYVDGLKFLVNFFSKLLEKVNKRTS